MFDSTAATAPTTVFAMNVVHSIAMPAHIEDSATRFSLGRYEVTALLARGGMGAVYLAEERTIGRKVALEVLAPRFARHADLVQRFLSELEVSRRVQHHGLVRIVDGSRTADGMPFLALELLDGENLGTLLDRGRPERGASPPSARRSPTRSPPCTRCTSRTATSSPTTSWSSTPRAWPAGRASRSSISASPASSTAAKATARSPRWF